MSLSYSKLELFINLSKNRLSYQDKNITCIDPCLPIDGRYVDRCFCRDNGLLLPKLAQVAPSSDTEALRSFKREGKGIFDGDARFGTESQLPTIQFIF